MLPNREILQLFKQDLWKDQRRLETGSVNGAHCLVKHFTSAHEGASEVSLIQHLSRVLGPTRIPTIVSHNQDSVVYSYIEGIRVFNLFVELDRLDPELLEQAQRLKHLILGRCEENSRDLQDALIAFPRHSPLGVYPVGEKVGVIIRILAYATGIITDWALLSRELDTLSQIMREMSKVPFRDATTKNMVLAAPELWLGKFASEEQRRDYLSATIRKERTPSWMDAPIFDFDFSSCVEASTPEDDLISLKYHERTWNGPPDSSSCLVWHGIPNDLRAACTFLVRYYRFGGRKAAYRLLHPWGHRIRFRHDNDLFYFSRLPSIVQSLSKEADEYFPGILSFTKTLARSLPGLRPNVDQFMEAGLGERRRYYVDMYPE